MKKPKSLKKVMKASKPRKRKSDFTFNSGLKVRKGM